MAQSTLLSIENLKQRFQKQKDPIFADYFHFLRFASIATDPAYTPQVRACADWLVQYLKKIGLKVETWETKGSPVLFASDLRAGPSKPTILLYNHYDVQPVDPVDLWTSPPFEPTLRGTEVFARGAADNKGQCFYTIQALRTLLEGSKELPFNLKYIIEGEEESGSAGLAGLLQEKKESLKADYLLIIDSGFDRIDHPAITLGARGMVCMTLTLTGSNYDLHSGTHGGLAYNPNRALVEMLASLHSADGRVNIPGFYDEVDEISPDEKKEIRFTFDETYFESLFGFKPTAMEKGFSPNEAAWLRPTLEINGLSGGYSGPGFKTVIPAKAMAKLSCRLVPRQNPETIAKKVHDALSARLPKGIKMDLHIHPGSARGFRTTPHSHLAKILSKAYTEVFQKPCGKILIGGSIPIALDLAKVSGAEMLLVGVGLFDDKIHAPDEHFGLDRLELGYLVIARALQLLV